MILLFAGADSNAREICIDELKAFIINSKELGFDLETNGFFPQLSEITAIGISSGNYHLLFNPEYLPQLKQELEQTELIGHNLFFDLRFLFYHDIYPTKYFDTFIAERLLFQGIKRKGYSLEDIINRYLGIRIDKTLQKKAGLYTIKDPTLQKYLINDVQYLKSVKQKQIRALQEKQLYKLFYLVENRYVEVLSYAGFHGFEINKPLFEEILAERIKKLETIKQELSNLILEHKIEKFINYSTADLFEQSNTTVDINWKSPLQVIALFKEIGVEVFNTKTGKLTSSYKLIGKFDHPLCKTFFKYGKLRKRVESFGINIQILLNKFQDNRIRTAYQQIIDSGRISTGGKTFDKTKLVNTQNPPRDKDDRRIYQAKEGYHLIIADYSQQEPRTLAEFSQDPEYSKYATNPELDIHCFFTQWRNPELANLSHKEIKEKHSDARSDCKPITFSIQYLSTAKTMAESTGMSIEACQQAIDHYYKTFYKVKQFYDQKEKEAESTGIIEINSITKRKRYLEYYSEYLKLKQILNPIFMSKYWESKNTGGEFYFKNKYIVSKFFKFKADIRKQAANTPIQGTGADMTKIAEIKILDCIKKEGDWNKVFIPNRVHDEIVVEAPDDLINKYQKITETCMMEAAELFLKTIPMKIGITISKEWLK